MTGQESGWQKSETRGKVWTRRKEVWTTACARLKEVSTRKKRKEREETWESPWREVDVRETGSCSLETEDGLEVGETQAVDKA